MSTKSINYKTWDKMETELEKKQDGIDYGAFENRVAIMADMIDDDMKSVLDLGAGNMSLKKYLSDYVEYYPVDYCKRNKETILCNFNNKEFPSQRADVIFVSGLLEYIYDYQWFIEKMCKSNVKEIIISYNVSNCHEREGQRIFYANSLSCDFVNALTFQEILAMFADHGFVLTGKEYLDNNLYQPLMKFEKMSHEKLGKFCMCSGCAACQNVCPVGAITMEATISHGYRPVVDREQCVRCGQCEIVCPVLHCVYDKNDRPDTYALWAYDEERKKSSSGGAAAILAKTILSQGGKVYGAAWTADFNVKHVCASDETELEKLRGSKYLQSDTSNVYRQIGQELKSGEKVLFIGTPCQVAGLNNYVGEQAGLYTVELICMGTVSPKLFKKYLEENYDISNIKEIQFRNKLLGWKCDTMTIHQKDSCIYKNPQNDSYQKGFHRKLFVEPVCETCQYACFPRQGDISVGDFWNISQIDKSWDDGLGTNLIMVNSQKGRRLLEWSDKYIKRIEKKDYKTSCNRINDFAVADRNRDEFYRTINSHKLTDLVENLLENKYDIGVVCMMNHNFGNNLTNYALYQFLKDQDLQVLMIDMPQNTAIGKSRIDNDRFSLFHHVPYEKSDIAPQYMDKPLMVNLNNQCRSFLLASDQLLRDSFIIDMDYYTCMDWVSSDKYKMTYATSFGTDTFELSCKEIEKCKYFLKRIQRMSVREESGIRIAKKYFGINAELVLDPVFLCDKSHYVKMISKSKRFLDLKPFIGAYILDPCIGKEKSVQYLAEMMTDGQYYIIHSPETFTVLDTPKVEDWMALISGCNFLITDSFHGMCFAILFQKQFCVYFTADNWRGSARIHSLLNMLGLSERLVSSIEEIKEKKLWTKIIDYEEVNKILSIRIQRSKEWIFSALKEREKFVGNYDALDLIMENFKIQYENMCKERKVYLKTRNDIYLAMHDHIGSKKHKESIKEMKIVGFGAGQCFERNIKKIKEICDLAYVCDNNPNIWGKTLSEGVICISPKTLQEIGEVFVVILVDGLAASFDIVRQLIKMDIYSFEHVQNWMKYVEGE